MPQASSELSKEWNGPGENTACHYLEAAGYILTSEWSWAKPTEDHVPTDKERRAVQFLIDEWDYGPIVSTKGWSR